jgi:hypothetical protein
MNMEVTSSACKKMKCRDGKAVTMPLNDEYGSDNFCVHDLKCRFTLYNANYFAMVAVRQAIVSCV